MAKWLLDLSDKCPRSMGFSPCASVISRETRAKAHATLTFVGHVLLTRLAGFLVALLTCAAVTSAAEPLTVLDLVGADAAFCLEVPHLDESWSLIEASPLMKRLRAFPAFQRFLESRSFQQWQEVEEKVSKQTGQKLSVQVRSLFGKSLVLAVYVPSQGEPRGILIGEATDAKAVDTAVATWNQMEPNEVTSVKTHRGQRYFHRQKHANARDGAFFVTSDRWFAISDQEGLIQDLIGRLLSVAAANTQPPVDGSLRESPLFLRNRQRLKTDAAAYLFISARPWDRGLEESSRNEKEPINPAAIWKHVSTVSASLQIDGGLVCDAVVELDATHLPNGWSEFVATAASDVVWSRRVPVEALFAVSGHLEISSAIRFMMSQIESRDRAELAKNRRMAQSLLGGNDLLEVVLPVLARNFFGYVVPRRDDRTKRMVLDGSLGFILGSSADEKLLKDVVQGLETALNLLAVYFSAEGKNAVFVRHEMQDSMQLSFLSELAPFPIGYGVKEQTLVIAGSQERVRQTFGLLDQVDMHPGGTRSRLSEHSQRLFPRANQLIWFDAANARQLLINQGVDLARLFSQGSQEESARLASRLEQARPFLELIDSLFVAGRIESDHVRITFGAGLDPK